MRRKIEFKNRKYNQKHDYPSGLLICLYRKTQNFGRKRIFPQVCRRENFPRNFSPRISLRPPQLTYQQATVYILIFLFSSLFFTGLGNFNYLTPAIASPPLSNPTSSINLTNRDRARNLTITGWQLYQQGTERSLMVAIQHLEAAQQLWQKLGDKQAEANALLGIGRVYADLGQKRKALEVYQQMLPLARSVGDERSESTALNNMGRVYEDLGEKQNALDFYQQALDLSRKNGDKGREASFLVNIGRVFSYFGEKQKALEFQNQALVIFQQLKQTDGEIIALNNLGQVYFELQDKQTSLKFYEQALNLLSQSDDKKGMATTLNNIGQLYFDLGNHQKAIACFRQALQLWEATGDKAGTAASLNNLGAVSKKQGDLKTAETQFQQALALAQAVGDRNIEASSLGNLAQLQREQGKPELALKNVENAIAIIEDLRSQIRSRDFRISYFATKQGVYEFYIDLLMELDQKYPQNNSSPNSYKAQAFQASEKARARGLIELLTEAQAQIRNHINPELLASESQIKSRLETVTQQLESLPNTREQKAEAKSLQQEINNLVAEYKNLQTKIRNQSPSYGQLMYPQSLTLSQIQQQLDQNTLLLQYSLGRDRSFLWAVTNNTFHSYQLPNQQQIRIAAEKFRTGMQIPNPDLPDEVITAAQELSKMILAPVTPQIKNKRLVIVGDGILQQIPFAALPDPKNLTSQNISKNQYQPLVINHEIINLPSASTIAIQRRQTANRQPAPSQIAILADPVYTASDERVTGKPAPSQIATNFNREQIALEQAALKRTGKTTSGQGFPRLPFTLQEAEAIANLVPRNLRSKAVNFDANYNFATSPSLSQFRILHFATHGFVDSDNPELSGLVLSLVNQQGQPQRGYLRLADLFNLNYPAELVVLSACDTGLGKEIRGEGLVGLTRGLMYAGAARIVISLWQVSDEGTAVLMQEFYQQMFQHQQTPAAALRKAQIKLFEQGNYRSPFYWAGFTIQGEWMW